jgi:hypothetical protein
MIGGAQRSSDDDPSSQLYEPNNFSDEYPNGIDFDTVSQNASTFHAFVQILTSA